MAKKKVYTVTFVQQTLIAINVVAKSKKEAIEITEEDACEWYKEKEEVLDTKVRCEGVSKRHHPTNYAHYKDEKGNVKIDRIQNIKL